MSGAFRHANNTVSAHGATAVTLSDSTTIPVTRALYVGVGGTLVVIMADNNNTTSTNTFLNIPNGTILPLQVIKVYSTGTTCTDVVALY